MVRKTIPALVAFFTIFVLVLSVYVTYFRKETGLEEIAPLKEPENVPPESYPLKLPWVMEKSDERTSMFYASSLPRAPELAFKVNISANVGGELAEAIVEGDKIFLADHQGVYALSREDGSLVWGVEVYSDSPEVRAISHPQPVSKWKALGLWRFVEAYGLGKHLYVGTSSTPGGEDDAYLIAFNKDNGDLVWKVKLESEGNATSKASVTSNLIVAGGRVFVGSVRNEGYVFCVSEDGVFQWRNKVGANVRGLTYGPGVLYVTSEPSTKLYALNPRNGEILWTFKHDFMLSTPIYKNNRIIVSDSQGNLLAVSWDGKPLWRKSLGISGDVNANPYVAVDDHNIYAVRGLGERPRNLFKLDLDGNVLGNFTMESDEDGGRPLTSCDVVILPVLHPHKYNKVYLLWRGFFKLREFKLGEKEEIWMPKVSAAYGEIYIIANPTTLYKFADSDNPIIGDVKAGLDNGDLTIHASACDGESGLHGVYLVYCFDGSYWSYQLMDISVRYIIEPIGGYGFGETPLPHDTRIKIPEGSTRVEFYVLAIDNVGNHETTNVCAYRIRK
ncbi:MAG: PQQ-binding-like beta-propeller repeat protein [Candidatus Bathyarchaeia archaeon]